MSLLFSTAILLLERLGLCSRLCCVVRNGTTEDSLFLLSELYFFISLFIYARYILIAAPSSSWFPLTQPLPRSSPPLPLRRGRPTPGYQPILGHQVTPGLGTFSPIEARQGGLVRTGFTGRQLSQSKPQSMDSHEYQTDSYKPV